MRRSTLAAFAGIAGLSITAISSGAMIQNGEYTLSNHPDGGVAPPTYGFRLDELYNATGGHDRFTFDFDHPMSDMVMDVTDTTIHIHGTSWGGRDTGSSYADDIYRGVYTIDFTYDVGVGMVAGDDDLEVDAANNANSGTIMTPLGDTIALVDERGSHSYSFRLGDENNDNGHRGFQGISGWGWVNHGGNPHVTASDWIFTAERNPIPTPGTVALFAAAGMISRRRRHA